MTTAGIPKKIGRHAFRVLNRGGLAVRSPLD